MASKIYEDINKLLKLDVQYNGNDTYSFFPRIDRKDRSLTLGQLTVSGSDEAMRKFCMKMDFKDCDCLPDSRREMPFIDMVMGMKAGIVTQLWVWRKDWTATNKKVYLE